MIEAAHIKTPDCRVEVINIQSTLVLKRFGKISRQPSNVGTQSAQVMKDFLNP
jgi:hypothetical protein